jgi:hypothetical protein
VSEREELARIIDPGAWSMLRGSWRFRDWHECQQAALAKADQWLSRPSPVDGVVEALRELYASFDSAVVLEPAMLRRVRTELAAYDKAKGETQ